MKVLSSLASASALLLLLLAGAGSCDAAAQSGWHVRVHTRTELKGVSEICFASGGSVACRGDLTCVQVTEEYGMCVKKEPSAFEQCGGSSTKGPWKNACVPDAQGANSTCVFISPYFSQCQDQSRREQYRFKGHGADGAARKDRQHHGRAHGKEHDASQPIALGGQCKWADAKARCAAGLQCIVESDHFGACRRLEVGPYEQCGGKAWKGPWSAACTAPSECVKHDEWFSQCLPPSAAAVVRPALLQAARAKQAAGAGGAAGVWQQCDGAAFGGRRGECAPGAVCVKHDNWYSQCKPEKLPANELCGQKKDGIEWRFPQCTAPTECKPTTPDGAESRCTA